MSTQWHPLFVHLLQLLIGEHYEVKPEEPVSDLPRRGDLLVIRRHGGETPPYQGLWSHLTEWNVFEFKGPSDDAEEDDLELLMHVGAGLTYRINEERRKRKESRLGNRQMSFWYLAPNLGETFLGHARSRLHLTYETGGLWRGLAWGHPIWLVGYRDAPVEVDTIPLHLLEQQPSSARLLAELILQRQDLLLRFGGWFGALQPALWKEIELMANTTSSGPRIDWETVSQFPGFGEYIRLLPPDKLIQMMGVKRAIETIGLPRVIEEVGLDRVIETVDPNRVIEMLGPNRAVEALARNRCWQPCSRAARRNNFRNC